VHQSSLSEGDRGGHRRGDRGCRRERREWLQMEGGYMGQGKLCLVNGKALDLSPKIVPPKNGNQ
jgi:hypothetical protein